MLYSFERYLSQYDPSAGIPRENFESDDAFQVQPDDTRADVIDGPPELPDLADQPEAGAYRPDGDEQEPHLPIDTPAGKDEPQRPEATMDEVTVRPPSLPPEEAAQTKSEGIDPTSPVAAPAATGRQLIDPADTTADLVIVNAPLVEASGTHYETSSMPNIPQVPGIVIMASAEIADRARDYLANLRFEFPPEIPHNPERIAQFAAMRDAWLQYGEQELGVDLSARLPQPSQIHIFEAEEFGRLKEAYGLSPGLSAGRFSVGGDIVAQEAGPKLLARINHEIGHAASDEVVQLGKLDAASVPLATSARSGYASGRYLYALDEALTEMANHYVQHAYWPGQPALVTVPHATPDDIAYPFFLVFMDGAVQEAARRTERGPQAVLGDLLRGKIMPGEQEQSLDAFKDVLGVRDSAEYWLSNLGPRDYGFKFCKQTGLYETRMRLHDLEAGGRVPIMEYVAPGISVENPNRLRGMIGTVIRFTEEHL